MRKINEYEIDILDDTEISLCNLALILDLQHKDGKMYIWVEEDINKPKKPICFRVYPAESNVDNGYEHIKTCHTAKEYGQDTWHLYVKK